MIIRLPKGAWERREGCGCSVIYEGTSCTHYQCTGHKNTPSGWWVETLKAAEPMPPYTHEQIPGVGAVSLQHLVDKAIAVLSRSSCENDTISQLRELANPVTLVAWQDLIFFANTKSVNFRNQCKIASVEADKVEYRHAAVALLKVAQFAERMVEALRFRSRRKTYIVRPRR